MQLTNLELNGCQNIRSLNGIQGMPFTKLDLLNGYCQDIPALKGMPLTTISFIGCEKLKSLDGLEGFARSCNCRKISPRQPQRRFCKPFQCWKSSRPAIRNWTKKWRRKSHNASPAIPPSHQAGAGNSSSPPREFHFHPRSRAAPKTPNAK